MSYLSCHQFDSGVCQQEVVRGSFPTAGAACASPSVVLLPWLHSASPTGEITRCCVCFPLSCAVAARRFQPAGFGPGLSAAHLPAGGEDRAAAGSQPPAAAADLQPAEERQDDQDQRGAVLLSAGTVVLLCLSNIDRRIGNLTRVPLTAAGCQGHEYWKCEETNHCLRLQVWIWC